MYLVVVLRILVGVFGAGFFFYMLKDCFAHKEDLKESKKFSFVYVITGFYTCVLDTLGIGNMATSMATFRLTKSVKDEHLSATGNTAFTVSTIVAFFIFLNIIEVDAITMLSMIASAVVGSLVGASIVTKWSVEFVRKMLGVALLIVAIVMICRTLGVGPFGLMGTATSLRGTYLAAAIIGNFFLGAFQTMGIGLYAPCMALVSVLGMNVTAAFPIMMGSCAFVMPFCSAKFVKEGRYARLASLICTFTGSIAVVLTYIFVKSIPLTALIWIVVVVMLYTSYTFFKQVADARKMKSSEMANEKGVV